MIEKEARQIICCRRLNVDAARVSRKNQILQNYRIFREDRLKSKRHTDQLRMLHLLGDVVQTLWTMDPARQLQSLMAIRMLTVQVLIKDRTALPKIIDSGIIPVVLQLLKKSRVPELQVEAIWVLTNIAAGSPSDTTEVVQCGTVPVLIHLLDSPNEAVRCQVVWAIGNIAADELEYRDFVLDHGVMPPLLRHLDNHITTLKDLKKVAWAIRNIARDMKQRSQSHCDAMVDAFSHLAKYLDHPDDKLILHILYVYSNLTDGCDPARIEPMMPYIPQFMRLMRRKGAHQEAALRAFGNLLTGNHEQTDDVMKHPILDLLLELLDGTSKNMRKNVAWTISNIAATPGHIPTLFSHPIMKSMIDCVRQSNDLETLRETAWIFHNITSSSAENINHLLDLGCIEFLLHAFSCPYDIVVLKILDTYLNIVLNGEGITAHSFPAAIQDRIVELSVSPNREISDKTRELMSHLKEKD
eukprot:TRINITY_DN5795_c0_g1_i1.p1 TRINITY_DN5795_c0_g1~~TRINITY_DN5795_c0_g1_i1.p1  ORF type:complete len:470 (+),score=61.38 TRINITY_DN5795_c0_g1_i1:3-1412(+)